MDFWVLGFALKGLLLDIAQRAFTDVSPVDIPDDQKLDHQFLEQISWRAVQGVRYKEFLKFAREDVVRVCILVLVLEPVRLLTEYFLLAGSEKRNRRRPMLFEFVNKHRSPCVVCLQYLSGLLAGASPRLQLLWRSAGCDDFGQWCARHKEDSSSSFVVGMCKVALNHNCFLLAVFEVTWFMCV